MVKRLYFIAALSLHNVKQAQSNMRGPKREHPGQVQKITQSPTAVVSDGISINIVIHLFSVMKEKVLPASRNLCCALFADRETIELSFVQREKHYWEARNTTEKWDVLYTPRTEIIFWSKRKRPKYMVISIKTLCYRHPIWYLGNRVRH